MTAIAPQTDVYLLKVPLELDELNQLTFASKEAQYNYFYSQPKLEADNFTYQRKDGVIRFPALIDDIITYNYVMYRNEAYSDKWFYAFITGKEYVNDNVTNIAIKTDVWQTWQFELTYKPVLIDREHTNDDTIGANLIEENLELGDYVVNGTTENFGYSSNKICNVVEVTMVSNSNDDTHTYLSYSWSTAGEAHDFTPLINGVPSGTIRLIQGFDDPVSTYVSPENIINLYDFAGLGAAIVNVYPMPKSLIGSVVRGLTLTATVDGSSKSVTDLCIPYQSTDHHNIGDFYFGRASKLESYLPRNNKLLTWPYCYFNVSNNAGTVIPYRYEDFASSVGFHVDSAFTISGEFKAYPVDYKNILGGNTNDYSITGAKIPVGGWVSDAYTNWLTQNALNMKIEWAETILSGVGGIAGGYSQGSQSAQSMMASSGGGFTASQISAGGMLAGGAGAAAGALSMGASLIGTAISQYQRKTAANFVPDSAGGSINTGDLNWAKYRCKFTFIPMTIRSQFARQIDEFFDMYGYKTNRVKLPNITGRRNWNFVKTVGCYIDADIPQGDLQEIKNMFDNGVTFWHNPATFADYTQNNDII